MKIMDQQAAQGDVLFTKVTQRIPEGFQKASPETNNTHIVTHSETGHHHIMEAEHVDMFQSANDPFVMYLVVSEPTNLEHLREEHTHETIQFPPGTYRVNKQREHTHEGFRPAID